MNRPARLVLLVALVALVVPGARRLLAMSNTQVHRINQHKPLQSIEEPRP